MIKLVEIYEKSGEYDSVLERNRQFFGLRDVFINPHYVVYIQENESLASKAKRDPLIPELSQEATYTQLMLMVPGRAIKSINVIGDPEQIAGSCEGDQ